MNLRCWPPVVCAVLVSFSAHGFAHAEVGSTIDNQELPTLDGRRLSFLSNATVNVFLFFRPGQEYSRTTLKQLAVCQQQLVADPVHWVAIVSDRYPKEAVAAEIAAASVTMPVLLDVGDALYGRLGVFLCPVVGITDRDHRLVAYQPFTKVNYVPVICAQVRHLLGQISDQELADVLHPPELASDARAAATRRRLKLAERLFQAGGHAKALANVDQALEQDSRCGAAHALRGQILSAQRHYAQALKAFNRALELEPTNAAAQAGKRACEQQLK